MPDQLHRQPENAAVLSAGDAVRALPLRARARLLFDLLAEAGATGIVIPGENGEIEGYLSDRTIALKYLKNKSWTIETVWMMQAVFARRGAGSWIDLGANIGTTVIPAALAGASCHAVEADPANLVLLRRNIARNGVAGRVVIHDSAVWDENTTLIFEQAPSNLGDHRVRTAEPDEESAYGESSRSTIEVSASRLDTLIDSFSLQGPVIVKLDVQGAEAHAFAGGDALFKRADLAFLEYWPYGFRRLGTMPEALFRHVGNYFSHAALMSDDQRPDTIDLVPFAEIIDRLLTAEVANSVVALDLVLSKSAAM